jgi:hypothetical protein
MCRESTEKNSTVTMAGAGYQRKLLLISKESFCGHEKEIPNAASMIVTGSFVVAFLLMIELTLRQVFVSIKVGTDD